jgi:hypothetical protein
LHITGWKWLVAGLAWGVFTAVSWPAGVAANGPVAADIPKVIAAEPLLDFSVPAQGISAENFELRLELDELLPGSAGDRATLSGTISRVGGNWQAGTATAEDFNNATHQLLGDGLRMDSERLTGTLRAVVRTEAGERELAVSVDARVVDLEKVAGKEAPVRATGMRFWTIQAETRKPAWALEGSYWTEWEGKRVRGAVEGRFFALAGPGQWSMGAFEDGLRVTLEMGTQRQNWNHARMTQHTFAKPRDVSRFSGLRVVIATDEPREDVSVSVWLGEADGSWYYVKSAVPLIDAVNSAVILFEDFAEAEWVAPGNHMDEDYVLDLTSIAGVAVGVVNPLGVGRVRFTIRSIELVECERPPLSPAQLTVTGRTLSVNGHNVVPAGIFGGYAPYLPQRFRPGCQRNLYAPSYPRVPRQEFARYSAADILDAAAVTEILAGEREGYAAFAEHVRQLIEKEGAGGRGRSRGRAPDAATREAVERLNRLLGLRGLYAGQLRGRFEPVGSLEELLARLERDELNDTEVMELNRRLLDRALAGLVRPVAEYGPTEAFYIDCFGERKEPAPLLSNPRWRENFENYGRALAENSRRAGYQTHWEFWNEPYLNWAERSRVNLQSRFFREDLAREGGPVQVKYEGGPVIPHFKWVRDKSGGLKVVDETAFTYWSGRGNGWIYDQMLAAIAPVIKKHNPDIQIIAGWGFRWNEDHWAAWDMLYKPTIDRNIEWIDGIHEHHYQGDTTAMNGTYEVLTAYGKTKHGKWLYSYNTETGDLVDAPARGRVDTPQKAAAASRYRKMVYNVRDCLYSVYQSPDKLRARTVIHNDATRTRTGDDPDRGWTAVGYGLMTNLRGRLIETESDDDSVWVVASVDGTDPLAMPPPGTPPTLVVIVFNDHRKPREMDLRIHAPAGTTFNSGTIERAVVDMQTFALELVSEPVKAAGAGHAVRISLPERSAWKISLPLTGNIPEADQAIRTQFFSADILAAVRRGRDFTTTVTLDPQKLAGASRAWLRCVVEDIAPGEAIATVAGAEIVLPKAYTADNVTRIIELPLDPAGLKETVDLRFGVTAGNFDGYRVGMTSIVLEHGPVTKNGPRTQ